MIMQLRFRVETLIMNESQIRQVILISVLPLWPCMKHQDAY